MRDDLMEYDITSEQDKVVQHSDPVIDSVGSRTPMWIEDREGGVQGLAEGDVSNRE